MKSKYASPEIRKSFDKSKIIQGYMAAGGGRRKNMYCILVVKLKLGKTIEKRAFAKIQNGKLQFKSRLCISSPVFNEFDNHGKYEWIIALTQLK